MITEDKITEIFCIVDDFWKFYDALMAKYTLKYFPRTHVKVKVLLRLFIHDTFSLHNISDTKKRSSRGCDVTGRPLYIYKECAQYI